MRPEMFPVHTIGVSSGAVSHRDIRQTDGAYAGKWAVPEECPVAFVYDQRNYAVLLATPQDLVDYAVGFSITEKVISGLDEIEALDILHSERGIDLRFQLVSRSLEKLDIRQRRRSLVGTASCGICGLEGVDSLFEQLPTVSDRPVRLDPDAIQKSISALRLHQPINAETRSVHAAAWVAEDGAIQLVREDVGRHNALDKLIGAMRVMKSSFANGFVLMSSRCSYELVEKAARVGIQAMVTISGPTGFALKKANEVNLTLYSRSGDSAVLLTD